MAKSGPQSLGKARVHFSPLDREEDVAPLRLPGLLLRVRTVDRDFESDFSATRFPHVVGGLVWAIEDRHRDATLAIRTVGQYAEVVRLFERFLVDAGCEGELTIDELRNEHVTQFEEWMRANYPTSTRPYNVLAVLVTLLRWIRDNGEKWSLSDSLLDRLNYVSDGDSGVRGVTAIPAYSKYVVRQLLEACHREIQLVVRRITVEGPALLNDGRDPRPHHEWDSVPNMLWYISRHGPLRKKELEAFAGSAVADRHNLRDVHRYLFPTQRDFAPFAVLLALRGAIEPDCLRLLPVTCLLNDQDGRATLRYWKPRARGWISDRVRSTGSSTPGGLIRLVQRLTRTARQYAPQADRDKLWLVYWKGRVGLPELFLAYGSASDDPSEKPKYALQQFVTENGIRDDSGGFLDLSLQRTRKTGEVLRYRAAGGVIEEAAGRRKSKRTFAEHYGDTASMAEEHEGAIVAAAEGRVLDATESTHTTIEPEAESPGAIGEEMEEGWLAHCRNPNMSPFSPEGEFCGDPFLGCLDCRNALVTRSKLPAILTALDIIQRERSFLSAEEWEARWGRPHRRITRAILPRFSESAIVEARAIAEAETDLLYLPPEFLTRESSHLPPSSAEQLVGTPAGGGSH